MAIAVLSFSKHTDLSVGICCLGLGRSPWLAFFGKVLCVADLDDFRLWRLFALLWLLVR